MQIQPSKVALVLVSCGFAKEPESASDWAALGDVDLQRASLAASYYVAGNRIYVTGMVPYDVVKCPIRLGNINANYLRFCLGDESLKICKIQGTNTFAEAWNACAKAQACGVKELRVVASDYYFETYVELWRFAAKLHGLEIEFLGVSHDPYSKSVAWPHYESNKLKLAVCFASRSRFGYQLMMSLANFLTKGRLRGFQYDGFIKRI